MSSSRRQSNGRSPLVNQQRQITSFFSKTNSPSPSPSPTHTLAKQTSKLNPNSKPNRSPSKSPSPNPSPTTPSPVQSKLKKPLLIIGQTPSPTAADKLYGKEVVEKRVRVYWPLDKAWYEGVVKSFDKESGKHLVQYDDEEEEELDLGREKIEWVKESTVSLKRLRRGGSSSAFKKVVIDDEDEDEADNVKGNSDDSSNEDFEEEEGEDAEEEDMDLEDEKEEKEEEEEVEEEEEGKKTSKRKGGGKTESRKRKACGGRRILESGKKSKTNIANASKEAFKVSLVETVKKIESK